MQHYFIDKEHKEEDYFEFNEIFLDYDFQIKSCDSIFSKDGFDYGTKVLLKAIYEKVDVCGKVLDIGCGYGTIGIVLSRLFNNVSIDMCDINATAVDLTKQNAIKNRTKNIDKIFESDAYKNVNDKYNFVITNPPIKAGKQNLINILVGAKQVLNNGGQLIFVIKKKHGEDSIKKILMQNYSDVEVIKRDSGYYILKATVWKQ